MICSIQPTSPLTPITAVRGEVCLKPIFSDLRSDSNIPFFIPFDKIASAKALKLVTPRATP